MFSWINTFNFGIFFFKETKLIRISITSVKNILNIKLDGININSNEDKLFMENFIFF